MGITVVLLALVAGIVYWRRHRLELAGLWLAHRRYVLAGVALVVLVGIPTLDSVRTHPGALLGTDGVILAGLAGGVPLGLVALRRAAVARRLEAETFGYCSTVATYLRLTPDLVWLVDAEKSHGRLVRFTVGYAHTADPRVADAKVTDQLGEALAHATGWGAVELEVNRGRQTITVRPGVTDTPEIAAIRRAAALAFGVEPAKLSVESHPQAGATWHIFYPPTDKDHDEAWQRAWLDTFCAKTGERWETDWHVHSHQVLLRPARAPLPTRIAHPGEAAEATPGRSTAYPFGQDQSGRVVSWAPLEGSAPHALLGGSSNAGKTTFITTLVVGAVKAGTSVVILDGKEFGLMHLRDFPGVERYCRTPEEFEAALTDLWQENNRRKAAVWESGTRGTAKRLPPIMMIVDEVADVLAALKGRPALGHLESLVSTGRETRVMVFLACLYPKLEAGLTGRTKGSLGCRVLLGRSQDAALHTMVFGQRAPDPSLDTPGRGVMQGPAGEWVEFQTWIIDEARLADHAPANPPRPVLGGDMTRENGHSEPLGEPLSEPARTAGEPSPNHAEPVFDLPAEEAAAILGCSDRMVTKHAEAGRLHRQKVGRRYLYDRAEVERLAMSRAAR